MEVFVSWSGDCGKDVAKALQKWLKIFFRGEKVWSSTHDIKAGTVWLSALFKQLKRSKLGVLCVTPDNMTAPWLMFEAGAICHGLESTRVVPYCFKADPSKLAGPLNPFQGVQADSDGTFSLVKSLNEMCDRPSSGKELEEAFEALWPQLEKSLKRIEVKQAKSKQVAQSFCERISGFWWERINPDDSSAISFVNIEPDPATKTIRMAGRAFDLNKSLIAHWETMATCVKEEEKKVFYVWTGWHPKTVGDPYEGFGEMIFRQTHNNYDRGHGFFSDIRSADIKSIKKKAISLLRCTKKEQEIMQEGNKKQISALLGNKLKEMD